VHFQFGGGGSRSGDFTAIEIADHQVVAFQHAFANAGGRDQNSAIRQAEGNVSIAGGDPAAVEKKAADAEDLLTKLRLGQWGLGTGGALLCRAGRGLADGVNTGERFNNIRHSISFGQRVAEIRLHLPNKQGI
jgi:hypothetical protein